MSPSSIHRAETFSSNHNNDDEQSRLLANGSTGYDAITQTGVIACAQDGRGDGQAELPAGKKSDFIIQISKTKFWLIFGGVMLQFFVAMFDAYFMASSHPVITSYFKASNSASWLSTAFMLTSTASTPILGRLSDTIGRRPVYLASLAGFIASTAWCGLSGSISSLIAGRAVCGIAAGGMNAMAGIMTNDLVRLEVRGFYIAYINLLYGSGAAFGAAFGGALCDSIGWRGAFAIQIPPILLILISAYLNVPSNLGPQLARQSNKSWYRTLADFDLVGSLFLTVAVAFLILGLNLGGNVLPWAHPLVIASLVLSLLASAILVKVESHAERPVIPLVMLSQAPRANLVLANFFAMIGINHILFNAPLYFQVVHGETPTVAGFRLAPPAIMTTCCGVGTGIWLTYTRRMKSPQVAGGCMMIAGAICLALMRPDASTWLATVFITPSSLGQGLMFPATTLAALAVSSQQDQAVITSTLMLMRSLGTVMGVGISSLILQNALIAYLARYITAPNKEEVISTIRKSVKAILQLHGQTHTEVVQAYTAALQLTFVSALLFFVIANALVWPMRLPRLGRDKAGTHEDGMAENAS